MRRICITKKTDRISKVDKIGIAAGVWCVFLSAAALVCYGLPFGLFGILWLVEWWILGNVVGIISAKLISERKKDCGHK